MRVEDRLRRGLEANATAFVADGEWRLRVVHRRHRRRSMVVLAAGCAAVLVLGSGLLAARGGGLVVLPGPAPAAVDPPVRAYDGPVVPDGTWYRVVGEAGAAALGVTPRDVPDPRGGVPVALTVLGATWAITTTTDAGVEVGDYGHATYDGEGHLVTSSASTRCPRCETVLTWRVEGDDLVLEPAGEGPGPAGTPAAEGRWRDRDPVASTPTGADGCSSTKGSPTPQEEIMDRNTVVALSVLATLAAGCSDDSQGAATPEDAPTERAGDAPPARVVEAGWERRTTEDRAQALGLPARTIARYVGEDGVLPLGLRLQQQTYAIYVVDDAGEPSTFDLGSYAYDDDGRLVLTSSSTSCSDCDTAVAWQQDGSRLVIHGVTGGRVTALDRLVWEGDWTDPTEG
jgi:hypothetical protein